MEKFWDLLEKSVIIQGVLTLGVTGAYLYMVVTGSDVPASLDNIVGLTWGFFFGAKIPVQANKLRSSK